MMRNLDTPVKRIRHKVFTAIAKIGFESSDETLIHDIEAIPYEIVQERAKYRDSIYRERAVASERIRLAMGLSLRPENKAVHLTDGLAASNIDEKYYEPPLMQVIPSACAACPPINILSPICAGAAWRIPVCRSAPKALFPWSTASLSSTRRNVSNVENANLSVLMTRSLIIYAPANRPAA